jgi:hypothetical protein
MARHAQGDEFATAGRSQGHTDSRMRDTPGGIEMKYMIMTFGGQSGLAERSPEWIQRMIAFMKRIDVELADSGELVIQQGLADPSQAKTVTVQEGAVGATAGPFAAASQSLAGFWIVDVENEARAIEIAARIGQAADAAIEVRQCMDAPPEE